MKKKSNLLALVVLDITTFVLMVLGITFSIFDVRFMGDFPRLSSLPIWMTFTGLSNVFIGLICLTCAIYRLVKKEVVLPKILFLIKIIALADITITFLTTALYLAPSIGTIWWRLYINNNIFNHFLTPLVAIVTFILFEGYVEHTLHRVQRLWVYRRSRRWGSHFWVCWWPSPVWKPPSPQVLWQQARTRRPRWWRRKKEKQETPCSRPGTRGFSFFVGVGGWRCSFGLFDGLSCR